MTVNERQMEFITENGTIYAIFILRRFKEVYCVKGEYCKCLVDLENVFMIQRKVLHGKCDRNKYHMFCLDQRWVCMME